ncbi:hypothetical protein DL763_005021 [Monosporascus cannonballus]|nr:hypothetical protein DL763_005021 [Monosporascus cannonballus]
MPPPKKKKRDRKKQTRLTFEPAVDGGGGAGASSSPAGPPRTYSPARVRFSDAAAASSSSPARSSPSKPAARGRTSKGMSQSRLHDSTGASAASTPRQKPLSASFMPKVHGGRQRATLADSSDESAAEVDDAGRDDSEDGDLPLLREAASRTAPRFLDADEDVPVPSSIKYPQSSQSVSTRLQSTVIVDDEDEDDDDDDDVIPPSSSLKRRRPPVAESSDEDDDDDAPILPSSALRRRRPAVIELDDDTDSEPVSSPTKKRKMDHPAPSSQKPRRRLESRASPVKPSAHKGHRSEKEKKMELLRRRRAGEKIEKLTSSESENDDDRKGIYDTDSEDEFKVLKEFDDDEDEPEVEQEDEAALPRSSRKPKEASRRKGKKREDNGEGSDEDLDDFVVEDDDGPLGAPANLSIPLEFTAAAHKPLKDQFPHVVEWLVHDKINPAFERKDPVYTNAWRKLDDEFRGLANSKFASSAWRTEFYRALKGRPKMEAYEMEAGDADKYDNCTACGRSGHPATFKIVFQGSPYYKDTLQEVESSDDEDSDEGSDDGDNASVDTQGMPLPPQSREWHVGAVCCSNAETAHGLIHWKHALKEWVEGRLEDEGWTSARRVQERERMKPKKRRALANSIVDGWVQGGVVRALYGDFKLTLENARNKATTGRGRMR